MMLIEEPIQSRLVPYFGCGSSVAEPVGEELDGCRWVCVPFCGSLSDIRYIKARTIVASDKHRHVVNLCRIVASNSACRDAVRWLKHQSFQPDTLDECQQYCRVHDPDGTHDIEAACRYFVTQWMGRSGDAGTDREFKGNLSIRWNSNGGDSNTRYRSAVRSLAAWNRIMRRCNFSVMDAFDMLDEVQDDPKHGIYCDPPWPKDGEKYLHKFTDSDQRRLAKRLREFVNCRVVVRFGEHPLIRELYDEDRWTWRPLTSRNQGNNHVSEFLIINGESRASGDRGATAKSQSGMFV